MTAKLPLPETAPTYARLRARRRIMLITDEATNRALIEAILRAEPDFEVLLHDKAPGMEQVAEGVDLVALDVPLPAQDLFELCARIKSTTGDAQVPLLLLAQPSAGAGSIDRSRALESGADDVLGKPFHRSELILRMRALLRIKSLRDELDELEHILLAMCRAADTKAAGSQAHGERVAAYAEMLGRAAGLDREDLRILRRAALFHDVGKLAIPDLILNKPDPLTVEETAQLRQQLMLTADTAAFLAGATPQIIPIIRHHHENVNGTGYPDRLQGSDIPLGARILAIADAYDAMTSPRPYRPAVSPVRAVAQLKAGTGIQWDKDLVKVFLDSLKDGRTLDIPR